MDMIKYYIYCTCAGLDALWEVLLTEWVWHVYVFSIFVALLTSSEVRMLRLFEIWFLLWCSFVSLFSGLSFLKFDSKLRLSFVEYLKPLSLPINSGSSLEYGSILLECSLPSWTYFSKISRRSTDDARLLWRLLKSFMLD